MLARQIALGSKEAVSIGEDIQDALDLDEAFLPDAGLQHGGNQIGLEQALVVHAQLVGLLTQFDHLELGKILCRGLGHDRLAVLPLLMLAALTTAIAVVFLAVAPLAIAIAFAVALLAVLLPALFPVVVLIAGSAFFVVFASVFGFVFGTFKTAFGIFTGSFLLAFAINGRFVGFAIGLRFSGSAPLARLRAGFAL